MIAGLDLVESVAPLVASVWVGLSGGRVAIVFDRLRDCSGESSPRSGLGKSSSSSLSGSTTGRVNVRRKILGAAMTPKLFSQIFLSLQSYNVGKIVEKRTCGGGKSRYGHHLNTLGSSSSFNSDCVCAVSGDKLGGGGRRLSDVDCLRTEILPTLDILLIDRIDRISSSTYLGVDKGEEIGLRAPDLDCLDSGRLILGICGRN